MLEAVIGKLEDIIPLAVKGPIRSKLPVIAAEPVKGKPTPVPPPLPETSIIIAFGSNEEDIRFTLPVNRSTATLAKLDVVDPETLPLIVRSVSVGGGKYLSLI